MGSDNWAVGHEDLVGGPTHVPWAGGENKRGGKGGYGRLRKTGLIHNCWLQHCSLSGDSRGWKADFKLFNQRVQWRPLPSATDHPLTLSLFDTASNSFSPPSFMQSTTTSTFTGLCSYRPPFGSYWDPSGRSSRPLSTNSFSNERSPLFSSSEPFS